MNKLYEEYIRTDMLPTLFCPGCGNGIVQVGFINAIDKLGIRDDIACVSGIGCSSWIPCYLNMDVMHTIHGRALPFAQGLKMAQPDKKVVVFTGDGDSLAIGGNHLLHASHRNIDITVVMVNNYIYGMTGGQKSPATPIGSTTKTSPEGSIDEPIDACELARTTGATYIARWTTAHPMELEKSIREGIEHKGFSFIEVLAQCPVQAGKGVYKRKNPTDIMKMYKETTYKYKEDEDEENDKIKIGVFYKNEEKAEYIDKINNLMNSMVGREEAQS